MYKVSVPLQGMLRIYISPKISYKINEQQQRFRYLPDPNRLMTDLSKLGSQGGVPAILYQKQGKSPELQLYTDKHYYLVLYLMERYQQGYALSHIEPLGLREQERMSKGVLLLQVSYWSWCSDPRALQGCNSFWNIIVNAWNSLDSWRRQARAVATGNAEEGLTPSQENYLSRVQMQVELEHRLEQDRNKLPQPVSYYKVEATGEKRYARDIYTFLIHGSPTINEKNMLRIVEERGLQARVLSYKGKRLTLKFEHAVDLDRIPPSGTFEPIASGAIYRTQQEALETLRDGEAKNPYLLRTLVEHQFRNYTPSTTLPEQLLNPAQQEAFQRALTLPDLLLVWGPPGTGKSRTITEIARCYCKQGRRVLITSGTHKAVDNVLEQFLNDKSLTVIRFGHEDRILEAVRASLTIDEQTRKMKQQIEKRTQELSQQLKTFMQEKNAVQSQVVQAQAVLSQWEGNQHRLQELHMLMSYARQRIENDYQPRIQALATSQQVLTTRLQKYRHTTALWQQKKLQADQKRNKPVLGFFYRWRANTFQKRLEGLSLLIAATQQDETVAHKEYDSIRLQFQNALNSDPEYCLHTNAMATVGSQEAGYLAQAYNCVQIILQKTHGLLPPFVGETTGNNLQHYVAQILAKTTILEKRAVLLSNWQNELETSAEQLTPEVLRYADIVGATCIGVATAKGLADLDFDLVIVDEAGQISTPNLLVPLVRARRAVLVGDHMQLPPFVDSGIKTWVKSLPPQTLQELDLDDDEFGGDTFLSAFTRSTFEQLLFAQPSRENLVSFTEQRRMPRIIAEFASRHFYNGQLTTVRDSEPGGQDVLFQSMMAFVDTSNLTIEIRKEQKCARTEEWGNTGFINRCEAHLIARLATHYEQNKNEWIVIVPYKAQADYIISLLEKLIEMPDFHWNERIATVDSFQGGERKTIIYGFTRSNTAGNVGFLTDLRRFNVAITRAKQQLVLVGDFSTLTSTNDPGFRELMLSLRRYVKECGELLTYEECQRRLG